MKMNTRSKAILAFALVISTSVGVRSVAANDEIDFPRNLPNPCARQESIEQCALRVFSSMTHDELGLPLSGTWMSVLHRIERLESDSPVPSNVCHQLGSMSGEVDFATRRFFGVASRLNLEGDSMVPVRAMVILVLELNRATGQLGRFCENSGGDVGQLIQAMEELNGLTTQFLNAYSEAYHALSAQTP